MPSVRTSPSARRRTALATALIALSGTAVLASASGAQASAPSPGALLRPGNLLVATSVFQNDTNIVAGTTQLPPGCGSAAAPCATAVADGEYPYVFNNASVDGSFNATEVGNAADKAGKDNNYRGMTEYDNVLYYAKGSGGNGIDTVYFVDTTGAACPAGTGLPQAGAKLPTTSDFTYSTSDAALGLTAKNPGLTPENMCVLKGFPTSSAKSATDASDYPFGLWFANPGTLYVADEGAGDNTYSAADNEYTAAAASTTAGLQKWVYDATTEQWNLAYTLQNGLNLGTPYRVVGYPTGDNTGTGGTGLPWAPATDGLRNITGRVNPDGTVSIWAVTSTVSGSGDQGADPNQLVGVTDKLAATALPAHESFRTVEGPAYGTVVRGVSFTPGTQTGTCDTDQR